MLTHNLLKLGKLMEEIGRNIKKFRVQRRITQTALAKKLNISYQQVQKYENGFNRISARTLYKISCILNIPISRFFEEPNKNETFTEENILDELSLNDKNLILDLVEILKK